MNSSEREEIAKSIYPEVVRAHMDSYVNDEECIAFLHSSAARNAFEFAEAFLAERECRDV